MSATTAPFLGRGTTLGYSTASGSPPYTYTTAALVKSVSPNITLGEQENVILSSTFKTYLPTIPEAEADFTIQHAFGDAGAAEVITLVGTGAIVHWQIKTPDASVITFDGFVKSYNPTFENESIVEADCSIRMTTMPAFA